MTDDPIAVLERELVEAARRRVAGAPPASRSRRRRPMAAVAVAVPVLVTIGVAVGALILLGGHGHAAAPAGAGSGAQGVAIPGRRELIEILGVLQRPQTKADLPARLRRQLAVWPRAVLGGRPDLSLVRFAMTAPWGQRLYLVPMRPQTAKQLAALARRLKIPRRAILGQRRSPETLTVAAGLGSAGVGTAATVSAGGSLMAEGIASSFPGGPHLTGYVLVVPDGVHGVAFFFARRWISGLRTIHAPGQALRIPARVHNNVAAVEVNLITPGVASRIVWYGANGRVIRRFGAVFP